MIANKLTTIRKTNVPGKLYIVWSNFLAGSIVAIVSYFWTFGKVAIEKRWHKKKWEKMI